MLKEENLHLFNLRLKDSDERDQVPLSGNKRVHPGMGLGEICLIPGSSPTSLPHRADFLCHY
jgi:hypothetical protein